MTYMKTSKKLMNILGFSDNVEHPNYDTTNKKVLGKFRMKWTVKNYPLYRIETKGILL